MSRFRFIHRLRTWPLVAALAVFIPALATVVAQQTGGGPQPKPLVPVAADSVLANPDPYYGQPVTITAAVEQILSKTAFSVAQRSVGQAANGSKRAQGDVLVVAPNLHDPVDQNAYVTVIGELVRFDPAEVATKAKDYKPDLAPDVVERYRGRPAVIATAVINAKMVDLARRLPPPVTAEEDAFDKVMKRVGPAFAALRSGLDESSVENSKQNVTILKEAFAATETFWKTRAKADAMQWAQDARKQVDTIERGVAGGDWETAKTSAGALGQDCQTCHTTYRERFDDGSYRIKSGT